MAKSIKLQDDTYLDTSSIAHDTTPLKDIVDGFTVDISRTDLNSYTDKFIAGYGHNLTNTPSTNLNLGHLVSIPRHDEAGYVTQLFSPYTTTDLYIRKCEAGTWGNWFNMTSPSYAQMFVYGIHYLGTSGQTITSWYAPISSGDFYCDTTNSRIVIPKGTAKVIEVYGLMCGYGYASCRIHLTNGSNGNSVNLLVQPQGNKYWSMAMPTKIMTIPDTTSDTYITLEAGGYNGISFDINNGFGSASYIGVRKIG